MNAGGTSQLRQTLDRLGAMPAGWRAEKVATPAAHQAASLAFLREYAGDAACPTLAEDTGEGWLALEDGLIHWKGTRGGTLMLHGPAEEMIEPRAGEIAIDVPGHGQSDDFEDMASVVEAAAAAFGNSAIRWPATPLGDPALLYPDMTPDRFGQYLQRAWAAARAEAFFAPWYLASAAHAIPLDPARLDPAALHTRARARIRAGAAARRWHETLLTLNGDPQ